MISSAEKYLNTNKKLLILKGISKKSTQKKQTKTTKQFQTYIKTGIFPLNTDLKLRYSLVLVAFFHVFTQHIFTFLVAFS